MIIPWTKEELMKANDKLLKENKRLRSSLKEIYSTTNGDVMKRMHKMMDIAEESLKGNQS